MYPYIGQMLDEAEHAIREAIAVKKGQVETPLPSDPIAWAEERFYIPSTRAPIVFAPHQRVFLKLALTRDANGYFPYRTLIYCVTPETRILTRDLRWETAGSLAVGDALVGFDEHPPGGAGHNRQLRDSRVTATGRAELPIRTITFDDGSTVRSSAEHPWLVRRDPYEAKRRYKGRPLNRMQMNIGWRKTLDLRVGDYMPRMFQPWETATSYEAGYLAAAIDGEGSLGYASRGALQIQIAQKPNAMLAFLEEILSKEEIPFSRYLYEKGSCVAQLHIRGRENVLPLLGRYRPRRLLDKLRIDGLGMLATENRRIVSIEDSIGEVVTLETSTDTYFAEGFAAHNSTVKQSGKSTIGGIIPRWYAETQRRGQEIYTIGNDQDQAKLRSFREIRWSLENTPGYDTSRDRLPGQWEVQKTQMRCLLTGTEIRALAVDAKGEAGGKPAIQVWCVDEETEALTREGFKRVVDLTTDDTIATLNPTTMKMEWHRPRHVNVTPYSGKMIKFSSRRASFVVTPNHRVFGQFWTHTQQKRKHEEQRQWRFVEARDGGKFASGMLKGDADWDGIECSFDILRAQMYGYFISEGSVNSNSVVFSQSKQAHPETYDRIRSTLLALGYSPKETDAGLRVLDKTLATELRPLGRSWEKYVPSELKDSPRDVLAAFFGAYIEGDGWKNNGEVTSIGCCTVSKRLADDLMEIGLKLGRHPRLLRTVPAKDNHREIYYVNFSRGPIGFERTYNGKKGGAWTEIDYDGLVACPSVEHGIFFIRRDGKCCWTGNTELWGFESEDALRFWDELTPIPTIPDSFRLIETYAGYEGESHLLWQQYSLGLAGRQLKERDLIERTGIAGAFAEATDLDDLVPIWENKSASLLMYWDTGVEARRMPWQTGPRADEYYREQENSLKPNAFARLHHNLWTSSLTGFVPIESWDACREELPPLLPGDRTPLVIGVDAATTGDCFAIVAVSRHPERHDEVAVRRVRVWDPKESGGTVSYDEPERFLRALCQGYCNSAAQHPRSLPEPECASCSASDWVPGFNVAHIAYDPHQLVNMMQRLAKDRVAWVKPFNQAGDRLKADKQLYDLIMARRITHSGRLDQSGAPAADDRLRSHIQASAARVQKDDSTLRIVKKSELNKIDATVALSMAAYRCLWLLL